MEGLARRLVLLARSVALAPWPTSEETRRAWAGQLGLPVTGTRLVTNPALAGSRAAFSAQAPLGEVLWSLQGDVMGALVVRNRTPDPAKFGLHRAAVEQTSAALQDSWPLTGATDSAAGSTRVWEPGGITIVLNWFAPSPHDEPRESRIEMIFSAPGGQ